MAITFNYNCDGGAATQGTKLEETTATIAISGRTVQRCQTDISEYIRFSYAVPFAGTMTFDMRIDNVTLPPPAVVEVMTVYVTDDGTNPGAVTIELDGTQQKAFFQFECNGYIQQWDITDLLNDGEFHSIVFARNQGVVVWTGTGRTDQRMSLQVDGVWRPTLVADTLFTSVTGYSTHYFAGSPVAGTPVTIGDFYYDNVVHHNSLEVPSTNTYDLTINLTDNVGRWSYDNGATWLNPGATATVTWQYTYPITYETVVGYTKPDDELVDLSGDTEFTRTYIEGATLTFTVLPAEGTWSIDGGETPIASGGSTVVPLGTEVTVTFDVPEGYATPDPITFTATGNYSQTVAAVFSGLPEHAEPIERFSDVGVTKDGW